MIAAHNLLDVFRVPPQISFAGMPAPDLSQSIWLVLHQNGIIRLFGASSQLFIAYPLIPWIGVMAAGYALGTVYGWDGDRRQKLLLKLGLLATALFGVVRLINVYGDPVPWKYQEIGLATVLSFFNTTKYPPSLLFLLMTLGPSIVVLALTDRIDSRGVWQRVCITFGRVPMFYYLLQWLFAHGSAVLLGYFAGVDVNYLFKSILEMGQFAPSGHGFSLAVAYADWIVGLIILYPICKWYGNLKRRSGHWLFSYL
jgi:uncharacterized membrane protein